jgi:hypothetical protein
MDSNRLAYLVADLNTRGYCALFLHSTADVHDRTDFSSFEFMPPGHSVDL